MDIPTNLEYKGKWVKNWFSNMTLTPIEIDGVMWPSVENYYQAYKCTDDSEFEAFKVITPSQAKYRGRKQTLPDNWDKLKLITMFKGLYAKFSQHADQRTMLLDHKERFVEWNNWKDTYWGFDINLKKGDNNLGKLLDLVKNIILNDPIAPHESLDSIVTRYAKEIGL